jgi:hypothetical protein
MVFVPPWILQFVRGDQSQLKISADKVSEALMIFETTDGTEIRKEADENFSDIHTNTTMQC